MWIDSHKVFSFIPLHLEMVAMDLGFWLARDQCCNVWDTYGDLIEQWPGEDLVRLLSFMFCIPHLFPCNKCHFKKPLILLFPWFAMKQGGMLMGVWKCIWNMEDLLWVTWRLHVMHWTEPLSSPTGSKCRASNWNQHPRRSMLSSNGERKGPNDTWLEPWKLEVNSWTQNLLVENVFFPKGLAWVN